MTEQDVKKVSVYLERALYAELAKVSILRDKTISQLLNEAIEKYLRLDNEDVMNIEKKVMAKSNLIVKYKEFEYYFYWEDESYYIYRIDTENEKGVLFTNPNLENTWYIREKSLNSLDEFIRDFVINNYHLTTYKDYKKEYEKELMYKNKDGMEEFLKFFSKEKIEKFLIANNVRKNIYGIEKFRVMGKYRGEYFYIDWFNNILINSTNYLINDEIIKDETKLRNFIADKYHKIHTHEEKNPDEVNFIFYE